MKYVKFLFGIFQFLISIVTYLWDLRNPKRVMCFRFGFHNHRRLASDLPGVQKGYRFGHWLSQNHLVRFGRSLKFKIPGPYFMVMKTKSKIDDAFRISEVPKGSYYRN